MGTENHVPELAETADATYCAEDNKLRLYPAFRLDREIFDRLKAEGFHWAPKQECFVAPAWTPEREDVLHELVGEVAGVGDGVSAFRIGDRIAVPHHVACGTCLLCRRGAATMCEAFKENLGRNVLFPQRLGTSEEFASMALECVTNSYMNGETIRMDGGIRMAPK